MIDEYYENHPLNEIEPDNWNNIPICIVKALKLLVDTVKNSDIDNIKIKG